MSRNTVSVENRFPPDLVFLVAEKLEQVLNDIGANTALATAPITPAVLTERRVRLRNASVVVADGESKMKGYRDTRDEEADDTYDAIVRLHDVAKGVYGARSIEYKRVKSVYDELRRRRTRGRGSNNTDTTGTPAATPPTV